jgi:hypothetical protein
MTRAEKLAKILAYRESGYTQRDIATIMRMSRSGVSNLISDPDGSKQHARRERYRGSCLGCGAKTDGSGGRAKAPRYCLDCYPSSPEAAEINARKMVWTRDLIVARIREWASIHGEPPAMGDWNSWLAQVQYHDHDRADRFDSDTHWPWAERVVARFGTWNAAIEAAGFTPRPNHGGGGNQHRRRSVRTKAHPVSDLAA